MAEAAADTSGGSGGGGAGIEILETRGATAASTSTPKSSAAASFSGSPYTSATRVSSSSGFDPYGGQKYGDEYTAWHSQCEFACRECGKVFRQPATLQNHIKTHHGMDSEAYKFKHRVRTLMTNEESRNLAETRKPCLENCLKIIMNFSFEFNPVLMTDSET